MAKYQRNAVPRRKWFGQAIALAGGCSCSMGLASEGLASEPRPRWPFEVNSGPFRVHADFAIESQPQLLDTLDQLCRDVQQMLKVAPPTTTLHVVLFGNPEDYHRYMQHYFPALPNRRALFIQQRGASMLFAYRHAEMATDLRHESVHAILNDSNIELPLWLDEGLAEYFEVPAEARWSGHTYLTELLDRSLPVGQRLSELEQLEGLVDVGGMSNRHYRDAWAWVHFLLHRRQSTRQMLLCYIDDLRSSEHTPPLSRTIARVLPEWRDEFSEHFEKLASPAGNLGILSRNP